MTPELKRIVTVPFKVIFWFLIIIIVLLDDFFRSWVVPFARWIGSLSPFRWLERLIENWHPYAILTLFLIPMAILEPLKLFALYVMTMHFKTGVLLFVVAKILGIIIAERIFAVGKDKLMTIGWFKSLYDLWVRVKERVYAYLRSTPVYPLAQEIIVRVKVLYEAAKGLARALWARYVSKSQPL
jgi:hypothetical protein